MKRLGIRLLYAFALAACVGLIFASLHVGCGEPASGANNNPPIETNCDVDADCESPNEVCSAYKVCLPLANGAVALGIELTPPPESGTDNGMKLTQYEIPPWEIVYDTDGVVRVAYQEAVRMSGSVAVIDDGIQGTEMQATLTATRASRLPGRPKVMVSKSIDAVAVLRRPEPQEVAADPAFTLMLPPNVSHTLRAAPQPPYDQVFHPTTMDFQMESDAPMVFVFGEPDATDYLASRVVDAVGSPVSGVQVRAVDETSGLFASTVAVTDETGSFLLAVPRGYRTYKLTFGPTETHTAVPQTVYEQVSCCDHDGNSYDTPEELGDFVLPAFPSPVQFRFELLGIETSGLTANVSGATLTFETQVGQPGGVVGTYVATASPDELGVVTVDLVPGDMNENRAYKVTIVTSPSSEFASEVRDGDDRLEVGPSGGAGEPILLALRVPVVGSVTADSPSLQEIIVKARRNDGVQELSGLMLSTTTGEDGRFNLLLDPGRYTLELQPPTSIPLPRWALPNQNVALQDDETVSNAGIISIPKAAVLRLKVRSANQSETPLENVGVKVYLIDASCADEDGGECGFDSVLLGEATTDVGGNARLIVPQP